MEDCIDDLRPIDGAILKDFFRVEAILSYKIKMNSPLKFICFPVVSKIIRKISSTD